MDERITHLLDEATAGLKDDPELQLDVRAELADHIAIALSDVQDDETETSPVDYVLRTFGSPVELAGDLLEANKRRMQWRALARLAIRRLLVPAAVLATLVLAIFWLVRLANFTNGKALITEEFPGNSDWHPPFKLGATAPGESARIRTLQQLLPGSGLRTRTYASRLHQFWQAHRQSPVAYQYYAYYANQLSPNGENIVDHTSAISQRIIYRDLPHFTQAMQFGMRMEPNNALYHYRLADAYLSVAIDGKWRTTKQDNDSMIDGIFTGKVVNPQLFQLGVHELRRGLSCPYLKHYHTEMIATRLALLPPPQYTEDYLTRQLVATREWQRECRHYRAIAYRFAFAAQQLRKSGYMADSLSLLTAWRRLPEQLAPDTTEIQSLYHLYIITAILGNTTADQYRNIGRDDLATTTRAQVMPAITTMNAWSASREQSINKRQYPGGILAFKLLSWNGLQTTSQQMAPTRLLDYAILDQLVSAILVLLLTTIMLCTGISYLVQRRRMGRVAHAVPILLLPPWQRVAKILCLGVILPLVAFAVCVSLPWLSGREYGIGYNSPQWMRTAVWYVLLYSAICLVPARLMQSYIRQRCRQLNIPVPAQVRSRWRTATITFAILVLLGALQVSGNVETRWPIVFEVIPGILTLLCLLALPITGLGWGITAIRHRQAEQAPLYHATVARSLIPLFATAAILVALLSQPYLRTQEKTAIRHDDIFFIKHAAPTTPAEVRLVQQLKAKMFFR